jgi:hypothetical protein
MSLGLVSIDGIYANKLDTIISVDTTDSLDIHLPNDSLNIIDSLDMVDTTELTCVHPLCLPLMYVPDTFLSIKDTTTEDAYTIYAIRRKALRYITTHHADLYVSISDPNRLKKLAVGKSKMRKILEDEDDDQQPYIKRDVYGKPRYWKRKAYLSLQLTQNYATNNWYQGAVNAFTMLGNVKANANYKKDNISWENTLEWRVGVSTIAGDTVHKLNTTDDRLQIYSKFGYQVHKQWYVSMFADFKTNLLPNF